MIIIIIIIKQNYSILYLTDEGIVYTAFCVCCTTKKRLKLVFSYTSLYIVI